MNRLITALALWALLAQPALAGTDAEYREFLGASGIVNWSNGSVSAEGHGLPPANGNSKSAHLLACRAALAEAQRNLLEATQGVRVTSNTLVQDFSVRSDEIKTTVEGVVKGARIVDRSYDKEGVCKVVLRIGLGGKMSTTLYKSAFLEGDSVSRWVPGASVDDWRLAHLLGRVGRNWGKRSGLVQSAFAAEEPVLDSWTTAYEMLSDRLGAIEKKLDIIPANTMILQSDALPTGLVIDARGSNFVPSLSPNIRQIRGAIIYPNKNAQNSILDSGNLVALFARSVEFAMRHPKVGERPLLLKGLRTWGEARTEIVLAEQSAGKVVALAGTDFFAQAGVIIVLD